MSDARQPSDWPLDPEVIYLNHGGFGSCPRPVQEVADALRARFERAPMQFVLRDAEPLIDEARRAAASLMGADGEDLVFVQNASTAVSTVLGSLPLRPDDELLVTDHAYNACRNALNLHARRTGMRVAVAPVPFPSTGPDEIVAAVLGAVTPRTRLALLVIGHGANSPRTDRSRFLLEFDWIGTHDPSAAMSLPAALRYMNGLLPGGLPALCARNHDLVVRARALLMDALDLQAPCPADMLGAMATLPLPANLPMSAPALYEALWRTHRIEAPVFEWSSPGRPMLRVCAQIYNDLAQYERLAAAVRAELRT